VVDEVFEGIAMDAAKITLAASMLTVIHSIFIFNSSLNVLLNTFRSYSMSSISMLIPIIVENSIMFVILDSLDGEKVRDPGDAGGDTLDSEGGECDEIGVIPINSLKVSHSGFVVMGLISETISNTISLFRDATSIYFLTDDNVKSIHGNDLL
jgi:hypothetical protein